MATFLFAPVFLDDASSTLTAFVIEACLRTVRTLSNLLDPVGLVQIMDEERSVSLSQPSSR